MSKSDFIREHSIKGETLEEIMLRMEGGLAHV